MVKKSQGTKGPRNPTLAPGVETHGRAASFKKRFVWKLKDKKVALKKTTTAAAAKTVKAIGGKANGKDRTILPSLSKFYPADDIPTPLKSNHSTKPTKLRESITPGTVLILLAGRFRGKRVVFLKQLRSGLLLVTGPYRVNGVPLKRVVQSMVIPTSTRVELGQLKLDQVDDAYFKRPTVKRSQQLRTEAGFFEKSKGRTEADQKRLVEKKKTQEDTDKSVLESVKKDKVLARYLKRRFTITNTMRPHELVF